MASTAECEQENEAITMNTKAKRRNTRRKRKTTPAEAASYINPAYYVGYVEELETVDMIMKKFEALDKIQKGKTAQQDSNGDSPHSSNSDKTDDKPATTKTKTTETAGLNEQDLEQLFRATSTFTVEAVAKEAAADQTTYNGEEVYDEYDDDGWGWGGVRTVEHEGEDVYFFGDGTDDGIWDEIVGSRRSRKSKSSGSSRTSASRANRGVTQIAFVSDMRGQYVTGLKKVRVVDPNAICYQRIPADPLPLSWAKIIKPYVPRSHRQQVKTMWKEGEIVTLNDTHEFGGEPINDKSVVVSNILECNLASLGASRGKFRGIFLDPPWRVPRELPDDKHLKNETATYESDGHVVPSDLLKLKLGRSELLESGFVFIWSPKHLIGEVLKVLEKMDFHYVENAVYVKRNVDNTIASHDSKYLRQSKETLLVCRRGIRNPNNGKLTWKPVEIRHQRTSDVYSDYLRFGSLDEKLGSNRNEDDDILPFSYVHNMMETMLPHARYNNSSIDGTPNTPDADNQGQLLHVWAPTTVRRTGWVTVSECR